MAKDARDANIHVGDMAVLVTKRLLVRVLEVKESVHVQLLNRKTLEPSESRYGTIWVRDYSLFVVPDMPPLARDGEPFQP